MTGVADVAGTAMTTLVVHGHFYQPPREDPRSGDVPVEPTAAPYHDWNARITAECYYPNTAARVVDAENRIVDLVDNYRHLSFNIGPTLLAWLQRCAPETYRRIVAAGRDSRAAIAQGYNHAILPLCNARDLRTQVRWGLADFAHRFGRPAEGMWLPETAVNADVLQVLAEEGVGFTILAPTQAARIRPLPAAAGAAGAAGASGTAARWTDVPPAGLDTSVPYRWRHPAGDGRGVTILFYDGQLSSEVAFGIGSLRSEDLVDHVARAAARPGRRGELVTIATDGETFGHHHSWADRTLAYALAYEAPRRHIRVASAAEALDGRTPELEVAVRESAWSCAHGVGRWRTDCGCHVGGRPGWHQRWRAPLRAALDLLRDASAEVFERRGEQVLVDPWAARDAYVQVLLGAQSWEDFAVQHVKTAYPEDARDARTLLESQRLAMAMYTSCGWFFDDVAGIEARIVLRAAAGLIEELWKLDEALPEREFLEVLGTAEGNQGLDGAQVWAEVVAPRPPRPSGGREFAPIIGRREYAQELLFHAIRKGTPLGPDDIALVAAASGIAVDDADGSDWPKG